MNINLISLIIFYGLLLIFFFVKRKKFSVQGILVLYRTLLGIKLMDKVSRKIPSLLRVLSLIGIVVGFLGMAFIFYFLIKGSVDLLFVPEAKPILAPVFPGIEIPGAPPLSFWHWIIAILIVAIVHEFSHGVIARLNKIKVKSSGFAFLGPILAAFVEPDEKSLKKTSSKKQLAMFSAGPFANILLAFLILLITPFIFSPIISALSSDGVWVANVEENSSADLVGLNVGEKILMLDNFNINNIESFTNSLKNLNPGDRVLLKTDENVYDIVAKESPNNVSKGYLGLSVSSIESQIAYKILLWFLSLFSWLFIINLGVGLFNLLPLGPVDGGRMFYTVLCNFIKDEKKVIRIWSMVSLFVLILIFINLWPYLVKLILFLLKPF